MAQEINLTKLFADLLALGKAVTYASMKKRLARESWLPGEFTPAVYTREIETPLLAQGWRKDGLKLLPPKPTSSPSPGRLKKVDPKRLRMLRDMALQKLLENFVYNDGTANDLATALRGLPVDPPSVDKLELPMKEYSRDEAILMCKALLNSYGLDITITERKE